MKNLLLFALPGVLLAASLPVRAQVTGPILPSQIDRSVVRPGARSLGLGGTTLFGSGLSAAAYNPAAIASGRGFGASAELVGRTNNLDVGDISDIFSSVDDLNDAARNGRGSGTDFPLDSFNDLYSIALRRNNLPLRVSATPSLGFSLGSAGKNGLSAGVLAWGEAIGDVRTFASSTAGARSLNAGAGLIGISNVGIPLAFRSTKGGDSGTFGATLKFVRADYQAASFLADEATLSVNGTTFDRVNSSKLGLDLGYISPSLVKNQPYDVRGAVSVRNALAPRFNLQTQGTDSAGNSVALDASFKQQAQIDAGVSFASPLAKTSAYAELHNITSKNGGNRTTHIGVEFLPARSLALRLGLEQSKVTAGLGLRLGGALLDVAVGQKPKERFALGLSFAR